MISAEISLLSDSYLNTSPIGMGVVKTYRLGVWGSGSSRVGKQKHMRKNIFKLFPGHVYKCEEGKAIFTNTIYFLKHTMLLSLLLQLVYQIFNVSSKFINISVFVVGVVIVLFLFACSLVVRNIFISTFNFHDTISFYKINFVKIKLTYTYIHTPH